MYSGKAQVGERGSGPGGSRTVAYFVNHMKRAESACVLDN